MNSFKVLQDTLRKKGEFKIAIAIYLEMQNFPKSVPFEKVEIL